MDQFIVQANSYCQENGFSLTLEYELPQEDLDRISERSGAIPSLHFTSPERIAKRTKNGCFILRKNEDVYGHIFVHKHLLGKHPVYERCTLWTDPSLRKENLGLLLMAKMTQHLFGEYVVSIAKSPTVHYYNDCLGMASISLSQLSPELISTLEQIGKLRDEKDYKYYIDRKFKDAILRIK